VSIGRDRRRLLHLVQSAGFDRPRQRIEQLYQRADDLVHRMTVLQRHRLSSATSAVAALARHMEALDPRSTLERGYVRVEKSGTPIRFGSELEPGDDVDLYFSDTSRGARITR
ncbi:MAG: exodeoxyribonuclease VII large subunit, partial [Rhodothermales bacterium]|nr:exodeoxyribonuclease VII large subunit [Rhodothermales bacterium]